MVLAILTRFVHIYNILPTLLPSLLQKFDVAVLPQLGEFLSRSTLPHRDKKHVNTGDASALQSKKEKGGFSSHQCPATNKYSLSL